MSCVGLVGRRRSVHARSRCLNLSWLWGTKPKSAFPFDPTSCVESSEACQSASGGMEKLVEELIDANLEELFRDDVSVESDHHAGLVLCEKCGLSEEIRARLREVFATFDEDADDYIDAADIGHVLRYYRIFNKIADVLVSHRLCTNWTFS